MSGARARRCLGIGAILQWTGPAAGSYKPEHLRRKYSGGGWRPLIDDHSHYIVRALQ